MLFFEGYSILIIEVELGAALIVVVVLVAVLHGQILALITNRGEVGASYLLSIHIAVSLTIKGLTFILLFFLLIRIKRTSEDGIV